MCLIDYGGHRGEEVKEFCQVNPRAFMQKRNKFTPAKFLSFQNFWKSFVYGECQVLSATSIGGIVEQD